MRKGCAVFFVLIVILIIAMFLSCPKEVDHRIALRSLYNEVLQTKVEQSEVNKWLDVAGIDLGDSKDALVRMAGNMSSGFVLNNMVTVEDYYIFSIARLHIKEGSYVVSVGVFNHVFTPSKEQVIEIVDHYL